MKSMRLPGPGEWGMQSFLRREGKEKTSHGSIAYLLVKRDSITKGILVNRYGIYAAEAVGKFICGVKAC